MKKLTRIYWKIIAEPLIRPRFLRKIRKKFDYSVNPSILSSNCIAGEIYNDLGMKFLSPTINLYMSESDFLKMMSSLQKYVKSELHFVENPRGGYPVAMLCDIKIHFLHYRTEKEAADKWYERCKRIDYDNIFMIMSDLELGDEEFLKFQTINNVKRKIMFTTNYKRAVYKDVFLIQEYKPNSYVRTYAVNRINGYRDFERFWNFVAWLNGEINFRID